MGEPKTEFEKMRAGLPYRNPDEEMFSLQSEASRLNRRINGPECHGKPALRRELLKQALGAFGESFTNPPFYWEYGKHIYIGDTCLINSGVTFMDGADIRIGDRTLIAPNVMLITAGHPVIPEERMLVDRKTGVFEAGIAINKPITIGSDCWIGAGAIVLGGVTIGDGTTVGAGTVVTASLPERVVAVGNPAKIVRRLPPPL